jgi:glycine oxidase
VRALREESGVDPEMTYHGHLVPALTEAEAGELRALADAERRAGLADTEFVTGPALRDAEPRIGPAVLGAQLRPGGQVDPRRLCKAAEFANRRAGVDMRYGAAVLEVLRDGHRVTGVRTLEGDLHAPTVIDAAGSWARQVGGVAPLPPVAPQRGEILALDQSAVGLRRVITKIADPYLVPRADGRLVIGATRKYVGYDSAFTAGGLAWLLNQAIELVPALADAPVVETWTGFRPNSMDGLPLIGRGALEGLFFATGHGPSGIAPAPASAALLASLVADEEPPIPATPFDPLRFGDGPVDADARGWKTQGGHRV